MGGPEGPHGALKANGGESTDGIFLCTPGKRRAASSSVIASLQPTSRADLMRPFSVGAQLVTLGVSVTA